MKIYLISLEQDKLRREVLRENFPQMYPEMQWIKAVNGKELSAKEYFFYSQQYFNEHQKIITPSEVGCTLSHLVALEEFLQTDEKYALILEDDVIGSDDKIRALENITKFLGSNVLLLCGGQEGLIVEKYILGKLLFKNIYFIPKFSYKFLARTCCYIIDRDAAKKIITSHASNFQIADHWDKILKNNNINFLFTEIIKHPYENNSSIEDERSQFYIENFWRRICREGVFFKVFNRFRNDFFLIMLLIMGYKKIKKRKS